MVAGVDLRYGYYLRPSAEMAGAQVRVHQLLKHQYGLNIGGQFMPHCTIKGFFKSDAPETEIRDRATEIVADLKPFPVYNQGVVGFDTVAITLSIMRMPDLSPNEPLQELHRRALDALLPLVASDCEHTPREMLGERWQAHLTLAMRDIPVEYFEEILDFCRELEPIGPQSFMAERLHLYAFESDN